MAIELSLESIESCLSMKPKNMACTEVLFDPETEMFLKNVQVKQDKNKESISQKLESARKSVADFIEKIISKEAAEAHLSQTISKAATQRTGVQYC